MENFAFGINPNPLGDSDFRGQLTAADIQKKYNWPNAATTLPVNVAGFSPNLDATGNFTFNGAQNPDSFNRFQNWAKLLKEFPLCIYNNTAKWDHYF